MNFSVLMSVYEKENPDYLRASLESILINQTIIPAEVVLVEDGPLTDGLYTVLEEFKQKFSFLKSIKLKRNLGLGAALNEGLKHCSFEWVARMDSDDIASSTRFEKQLEFIQHNPDIGVVGGGIEEFLSSLNDIISKKKVPIQHDEIIRMAKRRNPMCHMTVMLKKTSVEKVGGYQSLPYVEDYYLWVRMIASGIKLANLDDILVYARVGNGMFDRRGSREQIVSWKILNRFMIKERMINHTDYLINMISIIGFVYMPSAIKKIIYGKFLRK